MVDWQTWTCSQGRKNREIFSRKSCDNYTQDTWAWRKPSVELETLYTGQIRIETLTLQCNQNPKKPLVSTNIPEGPWQVVGTDLFSLHNSDYWIVTEYYSRYFEVAKLPNTRSGTVIDRLKSMLARHGIPYEVKSDNGPQYISQEFRQFAKDWNFKHTTSSPYHQQANGLAERTVQTVKQLLEKSRVDGSDPYLAILEYRNTATDIESPAKLLMSRGLRSILPVTKRQLRPKTVKPRDVVKDRKEAERRQQYYFNRSAPDQPKISMGQAVRF
ncbi:uncharacterized protein K02A2.6-like [Saccostrea cucullata]|uniref:uncharacterized protein K02A2.6-like n=1 Tax=Saccostrea cuccullata TaxID=36930 RepID=UPI002ED37503